MGTENAVAWLMPAVGTGTLDDPVRAVTDAEVEDFQTQGWVKLDGLVPREIAAEMLERAQALIAPDAAAGRTEGKTSEDLPSETTARDNPWWRDIHYLAAREPVFAQVAFSPTLARNVRRLQRVDAGVRINTDLISCKRAGAKELGNGPTMYHQDYPAFPFDRPLNLVFAFALDVITPEQGAMRFCNGSQAGGVVLEDCASVDLLEHDPTLVERYPLCDPITYQPGDATVHSGLAVHGGPANTTDRHRWTYHLALFSDTVRYTGAPFSRFDNLGLVVGEPFDHPNFPLLPD